MSSFVDYHYIIDRLLDAIVLMIELYGCIWLIIRIVTKLLLLYYARPIQPPRYVSPEDAEIVERDGSERSEDNDNTIPIESIPSNIQQLVVEKFTYEDFVTFATCSKSSSSIGEACNSLTLPISVDRIEFRDDRIEVQEEGCDAKEIIISPNFHHRIEAKNMEIHSLTPLTEELCSFLVNNLRTKCMLCSMVTCHPNEFSRMLKICKVEHLMISMRDRSDFPYETRTLKSISIFHCRLLSAATLFFIEPKSSMTIYDASISVFDIAQQAKILLEGENAPVHMSYFANTPFSVESVFEALDDLQINFDYSVPKTRWDTHVWHLKKSIPEDKPFSLCLSSSFYLVSIVS